MMAKDQKKKQEATPREQLISWAKSIAGALVLWLILRTFLVGAFHITSGSMEETLLVSDVLFVNKALYGSEIPIIKKRIPGFREPRRLDIVVFDSAEEPGLTVVKRLIGVPGDTVEMRDNVVLIDGKEMVEPYVVKGRELADPMDSKMRLWQSRYFVGSELEDYAPTAKNWGPLVVPPDSFLVMGDNRDFSYDSRWWGFLGRDRIGGRAMIVYFSYDRDGLLPLPFLTAIRWGRLFTILR
ncbi:MAG: signal peptidase I [Gemmatimonadetes bacterium]|nr:signal peptidase I [Gemmatimonadota bacterium]